MTRPRRSSAHSQRAGAIPGGGLLWGLTGGARGVELHHQLLQMRPRAATERRTPSAPLALPPAALKTTVHAAPPPRPTNQRCSRTSRFASGSAAVSASAPGPDPTDSDSRPAMSRFQTAALPPTSASRPAARTSARAPWPTAAPPRGRNGPGGSCVSPQGGGLACVGRAQRLSLGESHPVRDTPGFTQRRRPPISRSPRPRTRSSEQAGTGKQENRRQSLLLEIKYIRHIINRRPLLLEFRERIHQRQGEVTDERGVQLHHGACPEAFAPGVFVLYCLQTEKEESGTQALQPRA